MLRRYFVRRPVMPRPVKPSAASAEFPFHKVHHHRFGPARSRRTGGPLATVLSVGLSVGILVLLGGALAAGLMPPKSSENLLHPEKTSSKLITTSAQAALRVPEPPPPAPSLAPVLEEKTETPP